MASFLSSPSLLPEGIGQLQLHVSSAQDRFGCSGFGGASVAPDVSASGAGFWEWSRVGSELWEGWLGV